MKLSTKGRYGVRLMLDLAAHYGERPVFLREISEREDISEKYLWHLINPLKSAGLINSTRGAHGGYALAKAPSDITVKDIFEVVEGPICLVDCVGKPAACKRSDFCIAHDLWGDASRVLAETLAKTTLASLLVRQKDKKQRHAANYDI
ncbi:MAG: Rrf2 family transcriptional regulator [Smithellaceae bacterium]|nr:Rrf2 family transcriptional regulator [Smithellaceae bacterium]